MQFFYSRRQLQNAAGQEKELVRVEFWKYDPEPFAFDGCVDPVSLAESLKDIPDERVQGELEDYLEEFKW